MVQRAILRHVAQLNAERPLPPSKQHFRLMGVHSAWKNQRVGNSEWGHRHAAKRGGKALRRKRPDHLAGISRKGVEARNAERRKQVALGEEVYVKLKELKRRLATRK